MKTFTSLTHPTPHPPALLLPLHHHHPIMLVLMSLRIGCLPRMFGTPWVTKSCCGGLRWRLESRSIRLIGRLRWRLCSWLEEGCLWQVYGKCSLEDMKGCSPFICMLIHSLDMLSPLNLLCSTNVEYQARSLICSNLSLLFSCFCFAPNSYLF